MNFILFKAIEQQQIVCFTGRINILKASNKEWLGCLYLIDGHIVNAKCGALLPLKALIKLVIDYQNQKDKLELIVEPERLSDDYRKLDFPQSILAKKISDTLLKMTEARDKRPPNNLKLFIRPEFVKNGGDITADEFKILQLVSDYNLVKDIYENSDLFEFEITNILVNLRKKEALKVVEVK